MPIIWKPDPRRCNYAVIKDNREVAELLLAHGAAVEAADRSGATALHLAATRGYRDMVALLVAHGANVNARDNPGAAPLDEAAGRAIARSPRCCSTKARGSTRATRRPAPRR
jgi:ankyrin repeat protein